MARLTVRDGNGRVTSAVELLGPGGAIRFGIGSARCAKSSIWRVWANRNSSDVYIAPRHLGKIVKVSLHESGDWRLQWIKSELATAYTNVGIRCIDQWECSARSIAGWRSSYTIWVPPTFEALDEGKEPLDKPVKWVDCPPPDSVTAFTIALVTPDQGALWIDPTVLPELLGGFFLPNKQAVVVFATRERMTQGQLDWLLRHQAEVSEANELLRRKYPAAPRFPLFGTDVVGNRMCWDFNSPPQSRS